MLDQEKRNKGQYFTINNPFQHPVFHYWLSLIENLEDKVFLEPFSGSNNITLLIENVGYNNEWVCFDIDPEVVFQNKNPKYNININNSIENFPKLGDVVITNPPYLAKNSAKRRGLSYPDTRWDDLYKYSLESMLDNIDFVAAIIPESFLTQGIFHDRLFATISLTTKMFDDTDCPVCLALFVDNKTKSKLFHEKNNFLLYQNEVLLGNYFGILEKVCFPEEIVSLKFNDIKGELGLIAVDSTSGESIRFIDPDLIPNSEIKVSSRSRTKIKISDITLSSDEVSELMRECNRIIDKYREDTHDIFLTSFKGLRKDGKYRRRLDFKNAKSIINMAYYNILKKGD